MRWRERSLPSGAAVLEQRTKHCVVWVMPLVGEQFLREANWIVRCAKDPLVVDKPRGPDALDAGYRTTRGHAATVSSAKSSAMAATKRLARWEVSNAAEIEKIAKDMDKIARNITSEANAARNRGDIERRDRLRKQAEEIRQQARETRAQKFEGRRHQRKERY